MLVMSPLLFVIVLYNVITVWAGVSMAFSQCGDFDGEGRYRRSQPLLQLDYTCWRIFDWRAGPDCWYSGSSAPTERSCYRAVRNGDKHRNPGFSQLLPTPNYSNFGGKAGPQMLRFGPVAASTVKTLQWNPQVSLRLTRPKMTWQITEQLCTSQLATLILRTYRSFRAFRSHLNCFISNLAGGKAEKNYIAQHIYTQYLVNVS